MTTAWPFKVALSHTGTGAASVGTHRFRKDVIRAGDYFAPNPNGAGRVRFSVTTERMQNWVDQSKRMKSAGVQVPLTQDHKDPTSAEARIGTVDSFELDGETLFMTCSVPDDAAAAILSRCPEVSLENAPLIIDGKGQSYTDVLSAVTVCQSPVVPGQSPFQPITGNADGMVWRFSRNVPATQHSPTEPAMFTKEQIAEVRKLVKAGPEVADDKLGDLVFKYLADTGTALGTATTQLSTLTTEAQSLRVKVSELEKNGGTNKAPEIDLDVIEDAADTKLSRLSMLVEKGKLTPAALIVAKAKLIGETGKRPTVCLSRKAAVHAGLSQPLADVVIEILEANDPAQLKNVLGGTKTGVQRMSLVDDNKAATDADPELTKRMAAMASAGATLGTAI